MTDDYTPSPRELAEGRAWLARQPLAEPRTEIERFLRDALHPQRDSGPLFDPGELSYESPPSWSAEGMKREADRQAAQDSAASAAEGAHAMLDNEGNFESDEQDTSVDNVEQEFESFTPAELEVYNQLSPEDQAHVEQLGRDDPEAQQRLLDQLVEVAAPETTGPVGGEVPLSNLEQLAWDRAELEPEAVGQFESLNPSQQQEVLDQMVEALATTPPGVPLGGYQGPVTASSWDREMERVRQRIASGGRHLGGG